MKLVPEMFWYQHTSRAFMGTQHVVRDSCRKKCTCGRSGRVPFPCSDWWHSRWLTSYPSDLRWYTLSWWTTWPWWTRTSRAAILNPMNWVISTWWVPLLSPICDPAFRTKRFTNLRGVFHLFIQNRAFRKYLENGIFCASHIKKMDKAEFVWLAAC